MIKKTVGTKDKYIEIKYYLFGIKIKHSIIEFDVADRFNLIY